MVSGKEPHNLESEVDRQTLHDVFVIAYQYGILNGLLAGFTALIRSAYENEGLLKSLLDAALCTVIGTFVFDLPILDSYLATNPHSALIVCIVIGVVGANMIITTLRDTFSAAIRQLNPLTWFRKAK